MFLLGVASGMRSMTGIAVACWFAWLRLFPLQGTWAFWAGNIISVVIFTVFALGEYVGDTLPRTPNRTAPGPAIARLVFGALVGAIVAATDMEPLAGGILFGLLGAVVGTWGGLFVRRAISKRAGRDLPVALAESLLAIAIAVGAAYLHVRSIQAHPAIV